MNTSTSRICLSRFMGEEQGNVAIAFGLAAIPAFIIIGAALDLGRAYDTQSRVQAILDAATLAAANEYTNSGSATNAEAKLTSFVNAGLTDAHLGTASTGSGSGGSGSGSSGGSSGGTSGGSSTSSPVAGGQIGNFVLTNTTFNTTTKTSAPTLTGQVGTTLLGLAGIKTINVAASSSAVVGQTAAQAVEVSIMVDLTGSMGSTLLGDSNSKIANLRLAGQDIINILMPDGKDAKASVAIAPFADYVNAGTYAAAATNLSATGSYTNIVNLGSTKNGAYSGSYSGWFGTTAASQPIGSGAGAQNNGTTTGATYSNAYCATPTYTSTQMKSDYAWVRVNSNNSNNGYTTSSNCTAGNVNKYWWYNSSYQCQYVTAPLGKAADKNTAGVVDSRNDSYGGYWMQDGKQNGTYTYNTYDQDNYTDSDYRYYLPLTTTATTAGCETDAQPSGKLITCVTERSDANHYNDDEAPSSTNGYVGPYNKSTSGTTNKVNYSSDGKCWVAGRELPAVMPLSKDRSSRYSFFDGLGSSSVGGGTPGHLGTAWAWYMLSPKWKTVFTSNQPAEYGNARKVVVLMTDGEYNEQYSSLTSRQQALDLCTKMKAANVEVFTVGFGFPSSTTATDNSSAGKAMDLLTQCSSGTNHYYFPYNGQKLRDAFTAIGNSIVAGTAQTSVPSRMTH